eukprot:COSAG02_NODE_131_length_34710_cov_17.171159_22_plen_107_part_00
MSIKCNNSLAFAYKAFCAGDLSTRKALFREISNTASNLRTARFQARSPRPSRPAASTAFAVSLIFGEATSMTAACITKADKKYGGKKVHSFQNRLVLIDDVVLYEF